MEVILVKNRESGKNTYCLTKGREYEVGDCVVVEVDKGRDFGHVLIPNHEIDDGCDVSGIRGVVRKANNYDLKKIEENTRKEKKAFQFCREKILERKLEMKLIQVVFHFDRRKMKFIFTSANKVDFRELVKDLAKEFKTSIELRQVGVRDAAKMVKGIGICGRQVCCGCHLDEFKTISQKMVRVQDRCANPEKNSGLCGRLRCCLRYEVDHYLDNESGPQSFQSNEPRNG